MQRSIILKFCIDRNDKPIIYTESTNKVLTSCLIDTGANLPVWFIGKDYLAYRYPTAYQSQDKTIINGLGDKPLYDVPIWIIPEFVIKDEDGNSIVYKELRIAVLESSRFSFDMIIPLTMLNRMNISFEYLDSAVHGIFVMESVTDTLYTRPVYAKNKEGYLNRLQVFAEE